MCPDGRWARVVTRISPSAPVRIAPLPHSRCVGPFCTGLADGHHRSRRIHHDQWMLRAAAVLALGLLPFSTTPAPSLRASSVVVAASEWEVVHRTPPGAGTWRWPADPHPIVRPFIAPATPYAAGHRGIDIAAPSPTITAPAAGTVSFAGVVVDRPVLSIRHPGGVVSSYEPVTTDLVAGDIIAPGQPLGSIVAGHCSSTCLHLGVRVDGNYVSPLVMLGGIAPAVLLPTRFT